MEALMKGIRTSLCSTYAVARRLTFIGPFQKTAFMENNMLLDSLDHLLPFTREQLPGWQGLRFDLGHLINKKTVRAPVLNPWWLTACLQGASRTGQSQSHYKKFKVGLLKIHFFLKSNLTGVRWTANLQFFILLLYELYEGVWRTENLLFSKLNIFKAARLLVTLK